MERLAEYLFLRSRTRTRSPLGREGACVPQSVKNKYSASTQCGFSMIEVLVVLGMFAVMAGFGLYVNMENYRGSSFHSDRDLFVSLLQHARAQAISNKCGGPHCNFNGKAHGVFIQSDSYVLYQVTASTSRDLSEDAVFAANPSLTRTGALDFNFSQLTATTSANKIMTLAGSGKTSDITVSTEGQITWTH